MNITKKQFDQILEEEFKDLIKEDLAAQRVSTDKDEAAVVPPAPPPKPEDLKSTGPPIDIRPSAAWQQPGYQNPRVAHDKDTVKPPTWDQTRRNINRDFKGGKIDKAQWRQQRRAHHRNKPSRRSARRQAPTIRQDPTIGTIGGFRGQLPAAPQPRTIQPDPRAYTPTQVPISSVQRSMQSDPRAYTPTQVPIRSTPTREEEKARTVGSFRRQKGPGKWKQGRWRSTVPKKQGTAAKSKQITQKAKAKGLYDPEPKGGFDPRRADPETNPMGARGNKAWWDKHGDKGDKTWLTGAKKLKETTQAQTNPLQLERIIQEEVYKFLQEQLNTTYE